MGIKKWPTTPAHVRERAKYHRKRLTPPERRLWSVLRKGGVAGMRFRRQHPLGRYILDFYCPSAKLVVEVDGVMHDAQQEYDALRDEWLCSLGIRVLRVKACDVRDRLASVLAEIRVASGR